MIDILWLLEEQICEQCQPTSLTRRAMIENDVITRINSKIIKIEKSLIHMSHCFVDNVTR